MSYFQCKYKAERNPETSLCIAGRYSATLRPYYLPTEIGLIILRVGGPGDQPGAGRIGIAPAPCCVTPADWRLPDRALGNIWARSIKRSLWVSNNRVMLAWTCYCNSQAFVLEIFSDPMSLCSPRRALDMHSDTSLWLANCTAGLRKVNSTTYQVPLRQASFDTRTQLQPRVGHLGVLFQVLMDDTVPPPCRKSASAKLLYRRGY